MKIIVAGAGDVGGYLCEVLSQDSYDVTLIESSEIVAHSFEEKLDVRILIGNGASAKVQEKAKVSDCDFFLAMTNDSQTNIVAASIAKKLGAKMVIARVHDSVYTDTTILNYHEYFNIDYLVNPEALSAVELAKSIRNPERVAVENFAKGEIEVQQIQVGDDSKIIGVPLKDLKLPDSLRIGYVQDGVSLKVAGANTVINPKDFVTVFGSSKAIFENRKLFNKHENSSNINIAIYGGTEATIALLRLLYGHRFKIRVIEPNLSICKNIAENFPKITVINGSATSLSLLEEEQIGFCDYFISCTKKDEDNIMTSLQSRKLGAKHVSMIINKPDYEHLLENMHSYLDFDTAVSPRKATANEVLKLIASDKAYKVAFLQGGEIEIIELSVAKGSAVEGKSVCNAGLPKGVTMVALLSKTKAKVPSANDIIKHKDRVVLIVSKDQSEVVIKMFL